MRTVYKISLIISVILGCSNSSGIAEDNYHGQTSGNAAFSLQRKAASILALSSTKARASYAMTLVMDVRTGRPLVQVEWTSGDDIAWPRTPDEFVLGGLLPGDAMIPITVALALEMDIDIHDRFDAGSHIHVGSITIADPEETSRIISVEDAFMFSSHIVAVKLALHCGTASLQIFLKRFGIYNRVNQTEVKTPRPWRELNTMHISFGKSILVSPLLLLRTYAALVNGGVAVNLDSTVGEQLISDRTSGIMRYLLKNTVLRGRAKDAKTEVVAVGGVTAVMVDFQPANPAFFTEQVELRYPAFIGAFPIDEPRYAIIVMLREPRVSTRDFATAAAPVAANIIAGITPLIHPETEGR